MKWSVVFLSVLATAIVVTALPPSQEVFSHDAQLDSDFESSTTVAPVWQAYWDVDAGTHQTNTERLKNQGFRPISFSVYGTPPNANVKYSAVWVQRSGPAWQAAHNMGLADFAAWSQKWQQQGYVSTLVSATGPESTAVFMGLMEKVGVSWWEQRCALDKAAFDARNNNAWSQGKILKAVREYGTITARRYCAIWWANSQQDKWTTYSPLSYSDYQARFDAERTKPYWRAVHVTESEDHIITSIFSDTDVGKTWSRHAMTSADLTNEMNTQKNNGLMPTHLSGSGTGPGTRFIGLWAQHDQPTPRSWRATGTASGFKNNPSAINAVDNIAKTFMQAAGVRQAQIAIGKRGTVLLSRAYSWSESTRATTQPNDIFLLASVSKMFCAAAIQNLYDRHILNPSDKVYAKLGYTGTPNDARVANITVQDLIDHKGGDDLRRNHIDTVFYMRQIARDRGGSAPATLRDITDFTWRRTLDYDPGTLGCIDADSGAPTYCYSNQGYLLLSALVEKATGQSYYDFLRDHVLNGLDVRVWKTAASAHASDAVTQESAATNPSALQPLSNSLVASVFGGDGIYKESAVGPSSLAASAGTLVTFAATHAVWGNGGRAPGSGREGSMDGARTIVVSRGGGEGVDWAMVVNTRDFRDSGASPEAANEKMWKDAGNAINGWLDGGPVA